MDASVFAKMLSDPGILDLKKMGYKYGQGDLQEFLTLLKRVFYQELPLYDFGGKPMVYLESVARVSLSAARVLLTPQQSSSSTSLFHIPPLLSRQMCIFSSFRRLKRGISSFAWKVGSPPLNVIPPLFPKKAFWLTAIRTIASLSVGFDSPIASIVSGFAQ